MSKGEVFAAFLVIIIPLGISFVNEVFKDKDTPSDTSSVIVGYYIGLFMFAIGKGFGWV